MPEPMIVDVDANEDLRSRWGDHVPVIFVDGTLISYWTLDADTFLSALRDGPSLPPVLPDSRDVQLTGRFAPFLTDQHY
ncbi:hypothetical protein JCM18920_2279 [Cutibacterium acnes JCM 18920]|nr:hypothetical protein JCM18920_2279 [Cutibacterium acnes JCM 18920]